MRPATAADLAEHYPDLGCSVRAWTAEVDGEFAGMVGIALTRPEACIFSIVREPLRPFLRSMPVLKAIRRVKGLMEASRLPVRAIAEPGEEKAPKTLERLGMAFLGEFDGDRIYERRPR